VARVPAYTGIGPAAAAAPVTGNPLLDQPILRVLVRLSLPNMIAMLAIALVAIAETVYVGILGTPALAGMALVFPMVMLQQMMSSGAMGGGISAAISRALGAGDEARARSLAFHATVIGLAGGLFFTAFFLLLGPQVYRLLGASGAALDEAVAYSGIVFLGAGGIWLANSFASILRGSGNMRVPSATLLIAAVLQVLIGGGFGLGLGPLPRLGMAGVGLGQLVVFAGSALFLFWYLASGRARVRLGVHRLGAELFRDILKVGAVACISPLQTVLTVLILTRLVAYFGTEALAGYGIGARLEFLLIPITFAIGVACVPLVGMAIGAGSVARARRVAWTAGFLSAGVLGAIGMVVCLWPDVWATMFTSDPGVLAAARSYLAWAGPGFGFLGLGLSLYFASQGAGRVVGPVLTGTLRLAVIAIGGWLLAALDAPAWAMFALVGAAMAVYGIATAAVIYGAAWGAAGLKR